MTNKRIHTDIDRILVVIDPGGVLPSKPDQSPLLQRAMTLARATGADLELFHPCHDPSLEMSLFANLEEINEEKERLANRAATQLAELALHLKSRGLDVSHEVRWDAPQADAILRKIDDAKPDLVMKVTTEPSYIVGLSQNTDWELIRQAPVHLWFVKDQGWASGAVMTAIGGLSVDEGIITDSDRAVFRVGNEIAECLEVNNQPIHCYQVPRIDAYASYEPLLTLPARTAVQPRPWHELARLHGRAISEFAEEFGIQAEDVELIKGHPAGVLPERARSVDAGLLVMGARNLGRWERFFSAVAAEPVLAEAPCDLLFVKEPEGASIPKIAKRPETGISEIDLEMAIVHPEKAFKTPLAVAKADQLTGELRQRILDIWELDINAELREEDEGGPVRPSPAGVLKDIKTARQEIENLPVRRAS